MSIVVCGIDPSMTSTAICSGSDPAAFSMKLFESKNQGSTVVDRMRRLERLAGLIDAHLQEVQPQLILIEGYSHGSTGRISDLAEWGGILRWHLVNFTPDVIEVAPSTLKKFITGKGEGKKHLVVSHVTASYGQIFPTDDEVDAFALYQFALACAGQVKLRNNAQRESVAKVIGTRRLSFVTAAAEEPALF